MSASWDIGVDVGGTFVDLVAVQDAGGNACPTRLHAKRLREGDDPAGSVVRILAEFLSTHGISVSDVRSLRHGTTIATNALLELREAPVALFTTRNFADILTLGRQWRRNLEATDLGPPVPAGLCPENLRFEVPGRVDAAGRIVEALRPGDLDEALEAFGREVGASGPPAVAVSLLFSPLEPKHELALEQALRARWPNLHLSLSHRVDPHLREFERTLSTVLDAYVRPAVSGYLGRLETALRERELPAPWIARSFGGLAPGAAAAAAPSSLAMSGPAAAAAGVLAAFRDGCPEHSSAIGLDIGGTTSDISLHDTATLTTGSLLLGDLELRVRSADITSVPIGGGSLLAFRGGVLRVGPHSAGSDPGPACYGRGGAAPSLTDACLLAGLLPERLGGTVPLDRGRAVLAVSGGGSLSDEEVTALAAGAIEVAEAKLAEAIRRKAFACGIDPRRSVLVAAGGGGALHAAQVAELIGAGTVLVPPQPGVLAAAGLLEIAPSDLVSVSISFGLENADPSPLREAAARGAEVLAGRFRGWGLDDRPLNIGHELEIAFAGQSEGLAVPFYPDRDTAPDLAGRFDTEHRRLRGHASGSNRHVRALRSTAIGGRRSALRPAGSAAPKPGPAREAAPAREAGAPIGTRRVHGAACPVLAWESLADGQDLTGPALIDASDTTVWVPAGWSGTFGIGRGVVVSRQDVRGDG